MRVCAASLHPRLLSGQIDSLAGLGRALTRRGHDVTLWAPFDTTGLLDRSLITLHEEPHGLGGSAAGMLRTIPRIVAASRDADVLHVALPTPAFSWIADIVQKLSPVPVVAGFEGHLASARQILHPQRLRHGWKTYLPLWGINNGLFGRVSVHSCPAYVVSSSCQREELVQLGFPENRIHVIPNIVESSKLSTCDPAVARAKLGLPGIRPLAGYIGHFNDVKGVDLLAAAFASLASRHPDAHLALAWSGQGNPAPVRRLLAGLEPRVTWLGKVHVGSFLCAIDALALPYRSTAGQGAFPSLVIEALQTGCPLVTSDLPLIREIALPGETALLFPSEQVGELTAQLEHVLTNASLRAAISAGQQSLVRRRLASEILSAQYESLYRSVVSAGEEQHLGRAA
ncbi:MAG TPA: glycosyltransferase family 4 protein [Chloroflexota bacterium]|nr:glycosyltransferase family 4 protein [Chloroflexota bacterium]